MTPASLIRRLRDRFFIELNLAGWRRETRPLRRRSLPAAGRTVLFCDLMVMLSSAKVEALFAAALRTKGYRPVVLLPAPAPAIERIFRAAGPTGFVYLEERLAPHAAEAAALAERLMAAHPDLDTLVTLELDGYRIGRHVQSCAVRKFCVGRLNSADPAHRAEVGRLLARSLAVKAALPGLLDQVRPELALFCERGYSPAGEVFDACLLRGVDVVQWLGAPQSDRLLYKRYTVGNRDVHPLALSDETRAQLLARPFPPEQEERLMAQLCSHYESGAWFNRQQLQDGKAVVPRQEVYRQLGLDPARKTAVIFCHILYDATFFYGTGLFADYEEWLVETVRCAIANPALNWVVKVHPVNVWRSRMDGKPMEQLEVQALTRAFGRLPDHVRIMAADTPINTFSLFEAIDYGLTVRGTIGMELPCFGIPAVTAGTGRYSGHGFTLDPDSPEAFRALLARLHELPALDRETVRLARCYAFGTFFRRPQPTTSFTLDYHAKHHGVAALKSDVRLDPAALPALEATPDLGHFLRWITETRALDILTPDPPEL